MLIYKQQMSKYSPILSEYEHMVEFVKKYIQRDPLTCYKNFIQNKTM